MKKDDRKSPAFQRAQAIKVFRIAGKEFQRIACGYEHGDFFNEAINDECSNLEFPLDSYTCFLVTLNSARVAKARL